MSDSSKAFCDGDAEKFGVAPLMVRRAVVLDVASDSVHDPPSKHPSFGFPLRLFHPLSFTEFRLCGNEIDLASSVLHDGEADPKTFRGILYFENRFLS